MYLDYWGLTKHAFNNTPDPGMYFPMHSTVENAVAELLFAIEEGDECLAVVVGEVGLGKTMSLRVTLDSLDQDKYRIAFVTNPDLTFPQIMREIIGQLTNENCKIKNKEALLEKFNTILFETADAGKRVLIFIDEGNAIRRINLQSLRLLTNMQEDDRNLFTMILAGQPELARNLERPEMANLYQRIGVYCKLHKMESEEVMKDYIEHRLECAGAKKKIFTENAIKEIWKHSEFGVPRLVNRMAKLALKAGETNQLEIINEDVIKQIGDRFARSTDKPARTVARPKKAKTKTEPKTEAKVKEKVDRKKETTPESEKVVPNDIKEPSIADIKVVDKEDIGQPDEKEVADEVESKDKSHKELIEEKKKEFGKDVTSVKDVLGRMKERHRSLRNTNLFFR
ncbi:AAA family ATPase [candidate division KSB1 bacterium]|nr:AAA family ATPase [candidate division KSB1 bacterium]